MNIKISLLITILLFVVSIVSSILTFNLMNNSIINNNNSTYAQKESASSINKVSTKHVTDTCLNEWVDFSKNINSDIESASTDMVDQHTRYLVKNINGLINIYYLDNFNEEILYKKTDISTEYLSVEDLDNLEIGIEVTGSKELNQLLEDFE